MRKKILITLKANRGVKYLLSARLYQSIKRCYDVILLVGFDYNQTFERTYGGDNVSIYYFKELLDDNKLGIFKKAYMNYILFYLDFELSSKPIGRINLYTKKRLYGGRYRLFRIIYFLTRFFMTSQNYTKLSRVVFKEKSVEKFLSTIKPDLVVSTSPAKFYAEYCVHRSAKSRGIPLAFYPSSWDNFTRAGKLPFTPDKVLSWGPEMSRHAHEFLGIPQANLAETGLVRMEASEEKHREALDTLRRHFAIPNDHKIILAVLGQPHLGIAFPRIIGELVEDMERGRIKNATLILRPNNNAEINQRDYARKYAGHPLVRINMPEGDGADAWNGKPPVEWREVLAGSDVVLTVCSMMILEAFYYGTPVVNPNYNYGMLNEYGFDYTFYYNREVFKKIKELGGTTMADDRESLVRALNAYLADPGLHQERRDQVMEQWDVLPTPPDTRSAMAMRELARLID